MKAPYPALASLLFLTSLPALPAEPEFPLTADSQPHDGIPKGELIKATHTAKEGSLFPGTEREYAIYLPAGLDKSKPAPFMVFQDGVIYQAPTVFDNLIAKKEIPPLIGIFIRPGVVPAANDNALPRYNRSYEYDSVTDSYALFLIDEFLPAIKAKHGLNLSDDPNARAIAGNSSGGICAFMVAWHRPDQFRRVFTGVGTYVGIHGADQLPVLVRKYEPKPLRVFLQSGENDNNLYCGDWWMANQMMERSLTWNGYDVNHAWGKGGHNAKHATQIFPDVLRWLWKSYPDEPIKANPRGDAKWRGYEVIGEGKWISIAEGATTVGRDGDRQRIDKIEHLASSITGDVYWSLAGARQIRRCDLRGGVVTFAEQIGRPGPLAFNKEGELIVGTYDPGEKPITVKLNQEIAPEMFNQALGANSIAAAFDGRVFVINPQDSDIWETPGDRGNAGIERAEGLVLSPDQSQLFATIRGSNLIAAFFVAPDDPLILQEFIGQLERPAEGQNEVGGLCVDTNGWLYVATSLGVQVLDQAGRVNFIISTPKQPYDVCFGGKDLSELFIACGDTIYKRPTKAHGYISGQMAPIKPPPPKL